MADCVALDPKQMGAGLDEGYYRVTKSPRSMTLEIARLLDRWVEEKDCITGYCSLLCSAQLNLAQVQIREQWNS